MEQAPQLRNRLRRIGISGYAIDAAWPDWWSDAADSSLSAKADLRFSISRKLGLDPRSLLNEEEEPRFVWRNQAQFKHLSRESESDKSVISSFGGALGSMLIGNTPPPQFSIEHSQLRELILASRPFVGLPELIVSCWAIGVPIIHLRLFPLARKRMAAMAVRVGDRFAILLGKDSMYPPHIAFYVAHEIGHIALGHLGGSNIYIDFDAPSPVGSDPEEDDADAFALQLLTGNPAIVVKSMGSPAQARSLAAAALDAAKQLAIEPGTLALCFGHSSGNWKIANAAMKFIYQNPKPVWKEVNRIALRELSSQQIPDDTLSYLSSVLGQKELS